MFVEDQRYLHEDLERLEQAVVDRLRHTPQDIRDRLNIETEIAQLLEQIKVQSKKLLDLYDDVDSRAERELEELGQGEEEFYRQLELLKEHHARYPNQQAENSELRYRIPQGGGEEPMPYIIDSLFSGEEAFGRYFDLNQCFESFWNLPSVKRPSYIQYLDMFDKFEPGAGGLKRADKLTDQYLQYLTQVADYLESFMRRTRPLEDIDKVLEQWDEEFDTAWQKDEVKGWQRQDAGPAAGPADEEAGGRAGAAIYCDACEKTFTNESVHQAHLTGKKHLRAVKQKEEAKAKTTDSTAAASSAEPGDGALRLRERIAAEREFRVQRLSAAMSTERSDTRVRVERRQGMTERERQQELEKLLSLSGGGYVHDRGAEDGGGMGDDDDDENGEEKVHNPLKLPLAWDGKPIPFWLYRLHGLGVEYPCEICGNFVYMGRRAFDKHFNEARHIHGLKCLGIQSTALFRDITQISEATKLWDKLQRDKKKSKVDENSVVQMEDAQGNVMPEKVYYDLQKQGLL